MKTLKDYLSTDLKSLEISLSNDMKSLETSLSIDLKLLETSLSEASLLDIEGTIEGGEEAIKDKIENWIKDNFVGEQLKISNKPNSDGKYEVSAKYISVKNNTFITTNFDKMQICVCFRN